MDVRDYLCRIETRASSPTLDQLRLLHERHLYTVPFENLDIHLGIPIVLDEAKILAKIVTRRRGGFCYELNGAFAWLLSELGYRVTMLSAEVARPDGSFGIPFDHMALRVDVDDTAWLVDVGFGDSFLHPLPLEKGRAGVYSLTGDGDHWIVMKGSEPNYRFTLTPHRLEDFDGGCRYHQSSKESTFTQRVVTTRARPGGRVTLTKERLVLHHLGNRTETSIADDAEWRRALKEHFDIELESVCHR